MSPSHTFASLYFKMSVSSYIETEKESTRLCDIYLRDAVGLLEYGDVARCRQASQHCYETITSIGVDRLPRHILGISHLEGSRDVSTF